MAKQAAYSASHREQEAQRARRYYYADKKRALAIQKRYRQNHQAEVKARARKKWVRLKVEALKHYSVKPYPACVKCGFVDIRALSIDHIDGGGRRMRDGGQGTSLYAWLKRNSWPSGYQTLCLNCQFIKRWERNEFRT